MRVQVIKLTDPETYVALGNHDPLALFIPKSADGGSALVVSSVIAQFDQTRLIVFRSWVRRVCATRHRPQPIEQTCEPDELHRRAGVTSHWVYDTSTPLRDDPETDNLMEDWDNLTATLETVSQGPPRHRARNRFAEFGTPQHVWLRLTARPGGSHLMFVDLPSQQSVALLELCNLLQEPGSPSKTDALVPHRGSFRWVPLLNNGRRLHVYLPTGYEMTTAFMEFLRSSFSDALVQTEPTPDHGDQVADDTESEPGHQVEESGTCH
jgi:hypothetical protein